MNKKVIYIIAILLLLVGLSFLGKNKNKAENQMLGNNLQSIASPRTLNAPADKIEVVHFHATQQCWACIKVGEYAKKTIEENFAQELSSGKIVFLDINGEFPQNSDIVNKYKARGSSLFVNAIREDKDHIFEDVMVWRLIGNEKQFMDYFEKKLNNLLGN